MRDDPPEFAEDVNLFLLGDTGVVFSETAQEIYQLNATASFIWCQLEAGLSRSETALELGRTFRLPPADAERYVREALAAWDSRGFISGPDASRRSDVEPSGALGAVTRQPPARIPALPDDAPARHYLVLDVLYQVQFANRDLESWVHPLLRHLELSGPQTGESRLVTVTPGPSGLSIAMEGAPVFHCARIEEAGHLTDMAIFSDALRMSDEALSLHAGAVCQEERALILPGSAGSGKTTLTAGLVHAGLHYLSDDLVLLDLETCAVTGVPFSPTIKEAGTAVLEERFPGLGDLPLHIRPDRKRVRYLPLDPDRRDSGPASPPQVCWIVFPTYHPTGANELTPMASSKALIELTKGCTMMKRVTGEEVRGLIALVERADCFEIEVSSLDRAIDLLTALWHDRP